MEEMMNAIVFSGVGETTYTKVPKPKIQGPNDVLMKIEAASICGTDVHILSTPPSYPANQGIVQGHEFVGRVEEVGSAIRMCSAGSATSARRGTLTCARMCMSLGLQTMGDSGNMRWLPARCA